MRPLRTVLFAMMLGFSSTPASAAPVLLDFEGLFDLEEVTDQFSPSGLLFSGATALLSGAVGGSLNELEFPPSSGDTVVFDLSGPMRVDFATGAVFFSGRFTYVAPVTIAAYSGSTLVGSVTSQFAENYSGINPANELLELAINSGMTHVIIQAADAGGSFTLDDLFAQTRDVTEPDPVPEPGTLSLLAVGAIAVGARCRRRDLQRNRANP